MFYMKWLVMPLLGVIFVALVACSTQSISADHESDKGIFKDRSEVNLADTKNTNYQVYLQVVHRNGDGQLISIVESTANAGHISHKLTDDIFDTLLGKKEIIIIDNIKYEKNQPMFFLIYSNIVSDILCSLCVSSIKIWKLPFPNSTSLSFIKNS